MSQFQFFRKKPVETIQPVNESFEQKLARAYHRLMVLEANTGHSRFRYKETLSILKNEITTLQTELLAQFDDHVKEGLNLLTLQEKADNLKNCRSLYI